MRRLRRAIVTATAALAIGVLGATHASAAPLGDLPHESPALGGRAPVSTCAGEVCLVPEGTEGPVLCFPTLWQLVCFYA